MTNFIFSLFAILLATAAAAQTDDPVQPLSETPDAELDGSIIEGATVADPLAAEDVNLSEDLDEGGEPDFYTIRDGDTLTISVLEDPNLTRTVLVRPDGRISLPIAGSVFVRGVSPEDLEVILQERYSRGFQITPTVTVSIRGLSGAPIGGGPGREPTRYFLLGSVNRRGPVQVFEDVTILEALMLVGGPNQFAASDRIQIRRMAEDGSEEIFLFNWDALEDGDPIEGNITIEEGDIIYVPERGLFD
ncbi:MAG: polysaccharide biosynthesis/export family protein [Pseudomonadota bacterium]